MEGGLFFLKIWRDLLFYLVLAMVLLWVVTKVQMPSQSHTERISYRVFKQQVGEGKIRSATIDNNSGQIWGKYRKGAGPRGATDFRTSGPIQNERLEGLLDENRVEYEYKPIGNSIWPIILTNFLPAIFIVIFMFFLLNQMQNSGNKALAFGKSRARLHAEDKTRITFDDVAGQDEAKEELQEIVEFLKQPKRFTELGARIPKGVLLVGAPGTGKTLLAKAVSGEAGVPFFSISGSDFVEMFVGVGAARVRDLFDQAKKNAPCIVFVDELDAVGRQRGAGLGGGHDEREQTLNQLLVEMDGFEPNSGIIILAATNRPDVLDPALLRPGRFDRQVVLDIPDIKGREEILRVHAKGKPLADIDLKTLARRTPGFTGADLANVLNEAALLAARRGKKKVHFDEVAEAIERVMAGPEKKSRIISERERRITAYHEAGHAVTAYFLPGFDPVHKVSIIPRGRAEGYVLALPEEDKHNLTKTELLNRVVMGLGGRAAEVAAFDEISTGAQNDLENATKLVRKMVTEYGMSEDLGHMTFGHVHEEQIFLGRDIARDKNYSEELAAAIDREMRKIMDECYERALSLLREHRAELDGVCQALLEKETLEAEEFAELMRTLEAGKAAPEERQKAGPAPLGGLAPAEA
ncbi:MAG: ATP-dependent zinc metalloprotease FtsH [Patescibacteria group bacterium]